ncbi:hypothetical protein Bbelb_210260 [Branchiostoma belcheri]|nr:hypothetical protein Bbelb_210260 [Branchiostoma belcheri]
MAFSTKDRHRLHKKSSGMFVRRSCGVFWSFEEEKVHFPTWWIFGEDKKMAPVGRRTAWSGEGRIFTSYKCTCELCKFFCPDEMRLVMTEAPGDRIQKYQARSSQAEICVTTTGREDVDARHGHHAEHDPQLRRRGPTLLCPNKWRVSFRCATNSEDSCLNLTRLDWKRPDGAIQEPKKNISSEDSCLTLTRLDWTGPDLVISRPRLGETCT